MCHGDTRPDNYAMTCWALNYAILNFLFHLSGYRNRRMVVPVGSNQLQLQSCCVFQRIDIFSKLISLDPDHPLKWHQVKTFLLTFELDLLSYPQLNTFLLPVYSDAFYCVEVWRSFGCCIQSVNFSHNYRNDDTSYHPLHQHRPCHTLTFRFDV